MKSKVRSSELPVFFIFNFSLYFGYFPDKKLKNGCIDINKAIFVNSSRGSYHIDEIMSAPFEHFKTCIGNFAKYEMSGNFRKFRIFNPTNIIIRPMTGEEENFYRFEKLRLEDLKIIQDVYHE